MDSVAFRAWLNGIRGLDASQRSQALQAPALAEAGIPGAIRKDGITMALTPDAASMAQANGREIPGGTIPEPDLMARIGQGRLASVGARIATVTTFAPGTRPAASPGTVARPAAGPSIR